MTQVQMDPAERGKRRVAKWALYLWALSTTFVFAMITFGSLDAGDLDALVLIYKTQTYVTWSSALLLYGLDAAGMQIIPAIRGTGR